MALLCWDAVISAINREDVEFLKIASETPSFPGYCFHKTTVFRYAAYYGKNKVIEWGCRENMITDPELWSYAVNGGNLFILKTMQENGVKLSENCLEFIVNGVKIKELINN